MIGSAPIRVLIVDDSAVIRRMLSSELAKHPDIEVVGVAADPFEAHDAIFKLHPDVMTLDIQMPRMDGLTFLGKLMRHHAMPVVVHSSVAPSNSPQALSAMGLGAVDAVPKPRNTAERDACMKQLVSSIRMAATAKPRKAAPTASGGGSGPERAAAPDGASPIRLIGLAASTGGTQAIEYLVERLPAGLPCMLIVQHLPEAFVAAFAARLDERSASRVRVAREGEPLERDVILLAPGDRHLSVGGQGSALVARLTDGPKVNFHRPSADVLFRGMARAAGPDSVGIVLTGMGNDGAAGLLDLRNIGATTLAEAQSSCIVYGMPRAAAENGAASEIADLAEIPGLLVQKLEQPSVSIA